MQYITLILSLLTTTTPLKYKLNLFEKNSIYSGYDCRFIPNNTSRINDQLQLIKISNFFIYKNLLKTLENKDVSINNKMKIIEENDILNLNTHYSKYTSNIKSGGLMKDFDFEF